MNKQYIIPHIEVIQPLFTTLLAGSTQPQTMRFNDTDADPQEEIL